MASTHQPVIHDPERIRALTHPLRIRLLDLLRDHAELTATQCAELVGESVASCSFHLRTLEKYGFIERSEPSGKQKPWRLVHRDGWATDVDPELPGSLAANTELASATFAHRAAEFQQAMARIGDEDEEWIRSFKLMHSSIWATAQEVDELVDELNEVLTRFRGRKEPANRPDGARLVRMLTAIHVEPEK